jgi:phosphoglycolate phosphatase-like HAD superfamily hydrolase
MPTFVLFDIDGTLVSLDGAGSRSLNRAMEDLLGIPNGFREVNFAGKTDLQIIREGLEKFDLLDRDDLLHSLLDRYLAYLPTEVATSMGHVKEGVKELLFNLQDLRGVYLGLLTGNVEAGARLKLNTFGLNRFFPVGTRNPSRSTMSIVWSSGIPRVMLSVPRSTVPLLLRWPPALTPWSN